MALFVSEDVEYDTYTVKKGDTLTSISRSFNVTIAQIANLNDILSSSELVVGSTIKIQEKQQTQPLVYRTSTIYDDDIENIAIEAGKQVVTIDDEKQSTIDALKEKYYITGELSSVCNDVLYSKTTGCYSIRGSNKELNDLSINTSNDTLSVYSVKNTSSSSSPLNRVTMSSSVENSYSNKKASTQTTTVSIISKK